MKSGCVFDLRKKIYNFYKFDIKFFLGYENKFEVRSEYKINKRSEYFLEIDG